MKESNKFLLRIGSPFRELEGMRSNFAFIFVAILFLTSCNNKPKDTRPVVGEFDSTAIAADTVMQIGLEQSYEFNKTLTVNKNVVYDVIAWGTPTQGKLCFVYRNEQGVIDTVAELDRQGMVKDCWVSDMNGNKLVEVMAVLQNNDNRKLQNLIAYEVSPDHAVKNLSFDIQMPKEAMSEYKGFDNIYYVSEENLLYHEFPLMDSSLIERNRARVKYVLKGDKFEAREFEEAKEKK